MKLSLRRRLELGVEQLLTLFGVELPDVGPDHSAFDDLLELRRVLRLRVRAWVRRAQGFASPPAELRCKACEKPLRGIVTRSYAIVQEMGGPHGAPNAQAAIERARRGFCSNDCEAGTPRPAWRPGMPIAIQVEGSDQPLETKKDDGAPTRPIPTVRLDDVQPEELLAMSEPDLENLSRKALEKAGLGGGAKS